VRGAGQLVQAGRIPFWLCAASQAKSGASGGSARAPAASTSRESRGSSPAWADARPRRARAAATVVFPAPEPPVISAALVGLLAGQADPSSKNSSWMLSGSRKDKTAGPTGS
jgi:hypothetical protein